MISRPSRGRRPRRQRQRPRSSVAACTWHGSCPAAAFDPLTRRPRRSRRRAPRTQLPSTSTHRHLALSWRWPSLARPRRHDHARPRRHDHGRPRRHDRARPRRRAPPPAARPRFRQPHGRLHMPVLTTAPFPTGRLWIVRLFSRRPCNARPCRRQPCSRRWPCSRRRPHVRLFRAHLLPRRDWRSPRRDLRSSVRSVWEPSTLLEPLERLEPLEPLEPRR